LARLGGRALEKREKHFHQVLVPRARFFHFFLYGSGIVAKNRTKKAQRINEM
jgi:hypothetical protein